MRRSSAARNRLAAVIGWVRQCVRQETAVVAAILLIVGSLWTFVEIVDEIEDGRDEVDVWVADRFRSSDDPRRPIGPRWLVTAVVDATALGSPTVLTLIVLLVAGFLAMQRQYRNMLLILIASGLGTVLVNVLKAFFGRDRPDTALHLFEVSPGSFPSGHAMLSAIVYLTLGVVLATTRPRKREKTYIILSAVLLTGIVGVSRVYLGVHHVTDVLGGWAVGLCWAMVCLLIARYIQSRIGRSCGWEQH